MNCPVNINVIRMTLGAGKTVIFLRYTVYGMKSTVRGNGVLLTHIDEPFSLHVHYTFLSVSMVIRWLSAFRHISLFHTPVCKYFLFIPIPLTPTEPRL